MRSQVRLFAGLREAAGWAERELEGVERVADVWPALGLGNEPEGLLYAVNREYAERGRELHDGDEVALIPPVSGGAFRVTDEPLSLEAVAAEVEERHGVPVEVVAVGDRDLDPATEAVVSAAREAMTNAAKFGGGSTVDVYAECSDDRLQVFVRDRGPGFDPEEIPADRRGVRESIVGRMERHGGRATITSAPGAGTEVELLLEAGG